MSNDNQAVVRTGSGALEGFFENDLYMFRGIPYAAAPTGALRWLPPQPVAPWDGIRPAKRYGAMAPQVAMSAPGDSPGAPNFGNVPQSEDCLYLNVWTPGLDDAKRPVMLWIHGGGFTIGSGSETFLDSGLLPKRGNFVFVSLNYRLGALGFLNLNEITGGTIPSTGNEGILDQVAALDWIQENIAAFGGDPDNVTIAGFSAGGMSVGTLLGLPAARGKFHKAMNRSGAANMVGTGEDALEIGEMFLALSGCDGRDAGALRNISITDMLVLQQKLSNEYQRTHGMLLPLRPIVDGTVLPEKPMVSLNNGYAKDITIMAGTSRDELKSMNAGNPSVTKMDETGLRKRLNGLVPAEFVPRLIEAYGNSLKSRENPVTPGDIYNAINIDHLFTIPTIRLVEAQRDNGARAYNYLFTYCSPAMNGALGAMHGLDNPFLFDGLDAAFTGNGPEQQKLAVQIQDSCAAFLHTGDPSCKSIGEWPVYGSAASTMLLDVESHVEQAPFDEERHAWDGYTV